MFPSPKPLPFTIIRNARVPSKLPAVPLETSAKSLKSPPNSLTLASYNRKDKSLEELSRKFLQMFLSSQESCISLDRITEALGVERRRIYDIINILESLNLVSRKGKNNYRWNGFHKVYETLKAFENGSFSRFFAKIQEELGFQEEKLEISQTFADNRQEIQPKSQETASFSEVPENFLEKMANASENAKKVRETAPIKREKSLKLLSIGFLELFLRWKSTMSLEEAAKRLNERLNVEENKIKTKIRRLYDIANVFKSLGLIRKTLTDHKKPAFTWLGTPGLDEFVESNRVSEEKLGESKRNNTEFLVKCLMNLIENNGKSPNKLSFVTPIVKKTLTIIYPDTQTTASNEKSEAFTREVENFLIPQPIFKEKDANSLKECTNTMKNYKRSALAPISQELGMSRASSFKKIKRSCDFAADKENFNPF